MMLKSNCRRVFHRWHCLALSALSFIAPLVGAQTVAPAEKVGYHGELIGSGRDAAGWSVFSLAPQARIIYVSSSSGNDQNDGRTETSPMKTLKAAATLLRPGFGDWMMLRRGDHWTDENMAGLLPSGRSSRYPTLIGAYGERGQRPVLKVAGRFINVIKAMHHVAVTDLHIVAYKRDPKYPSPPPDHDCASIVLDSGANILLEGIKFEYCGISIQGELKEIGKGRINNIIVRRSVVAYSYSGGHAHAQGIYAQGIDNLLLEDNVFYQSGWNPQAGTPPNVFKHGLYLHAGNANVSVVGNIIAESSSNGLQQRSGGVTLDNLFIRNGIAAFTGTSGETQQKRKSHLPDSINPITGRPFWKGDDIIFAENIAVDPDNIYPRVGTSLSAAGATNVLRGWGFEIKHAERAWVANNIVANRRADNAYDGYAGAFVIGPDGSIESADYVISGNIVYNHGKAMDLIFKGAAKVVVTMTNNIFQETRSEVMSYPPRFAFWSFVGDRIPRFQGANNTFYDAVHPQCAMNSVNGTLLKLHEIHQFVSLAECKKVVFPDPMRSIGSYMTALGIPGNYDGFWQHALNQGKFSWDPRFTASVVNTYLRQGFGRKRMIFDTDELTGSRTVER